MKAKLQKAAVVVTALAMTASIGSVTALAADTSYGYLAGQQQSTDRHAQFEKAAALTTDAERESFLAEQGIGEGGAYSTSEHLDAQSLVEAGVIDQATADKITAYAAQKHTGLQGKFVSKAAMTPQERHTFYADFAADASEGDSVEELLAAGVITQAQADAINTYLAQ